MTFVPLPDAIIPAATDPRPSATCDGGPWRYFATSAASVAKVGALALIGGLAYKAFQNYQGGKPLVSGVTAPEAAPKGSGFEPAAVTNESATLYIKAMIAAAAADGRIDNAEHAKIIGSLTQAGLDDGAEEFLANELNNPASIDDLGGSFDPGRGRAGLHRRPHCH